MLHGNIIYDARSRGIAREGEMLHGNIYMMLVHEGLPEGEMLHGNI